ncbi:DUF2130 domain-containing protein [bacterium]|jgi:hypothetical protein|nr:DUF2130 domain-containing protein [bacterium]MDB4724695.1 DUF2130 domain-containing protein [Planctomycetota bacterium]
MSEISCPHCKKAFQVDESGYAEILKQVRNEEFEQQLHERLELAERETLAKLEKAEVAKDLAVKEALTEAVQERDQARNEIESLRREAKSAQELARAKADQALEEASSSKERQIQALEAKLESKATEQDLAITRAVTVVEKERDDLNGKLQRASMEKELSEQAMRDKFETQIKDRDDAIERLKDMKARLSTKMLGESLELHCENAFNQLRATAFPRAYFEKDNDASTGSKGDYIFRDRDEADIEIVSIMFEMKNEADTTATKKRNEDFFKELDKDRTEKGCEYAVLVSLLESESDLYNSGIVDVSHRFEKMYVIRPQFFIPMITLLRNAAMGALEYKSELAMVKAQNIDITTFEGDLDTFKTAFGKNYDLASRRFQTAIDEIDKSINHLQKTKDALLGADRNLRLANDKAQDVTIKKLTRKNPTMAEKFRLLDSTEPD